MLIWRVEIVCLALFAVACGASAPAALPPSSPSPLLGKAAPSFRRPTVQGGQFDTAAVSGQVLVVEFFAQYCRPCQRRLPAAERLRAELPDVAVVGISVDETPDLALQQVRRYGLKFPVIHDPGHALAGRFRVTSLPVAVVVGRGGRVRWVAGPGQPEGALRRAVWAARQQGVENAPDPG